ncbi:hypothetical protein N658DRAFT_490123 [Parathielavia hyrcaniae]|uniref:Uncharacterized protein n=1 Tax=Parathielavia hyrcaniae TaxID=113614 RepID=A0AAN6PR76_9PEZI|nr:hypothetical protein N658DRAFT_490123 [Parathielavia hyrcaniae]
MATTPATTATSNVTTGRAEDGLPRFTPAPDCFTDLYRFRFYSCGPDSLSCTYFQVGKRWGDTSCIPDFPIHPATDCPVSYTAVATEERVDIYGTKCDVACCPEGFGFTFNGPSSLATALVEHLQVPLKCVARTPTLPGRDGPPWTVTVTHPNSPGTAAALGGVVTIGTSDILVATYARVVYQVHDGSTCASNCRHPWKTGDPWPVPTTTSSPLSNTATGIPEPCRHFCDARPPLAGLNIGPIGGGAGSRLRGPVARGGRNPTLEGRKSPSDL